MAQKGRPKKSLPANAQGSNADLLPVKEPRCKICISPIRDRIDRLSAAGYGATAIAEEIMGIDPKLSTNIDTLRKNIDRHAKSHLRIKEKAIRRILENRAKQQGLLLENVETVYVNEMGLLDILVKQATEQSTDPNFRVHMKDALEAIKIKKDIEASEFSEQIKVMEKQVWAITQAVKDIVPEEYFGRITNRARQLFEGELIDLPYVEEKVIEVEQKEIENGFNRSLN